MGSCLFRLVAFPTLNAERKKYVLHSVDPQRHQNGNCAQPGRLCTFAGKTTCRPGVFLFPSVFFGDLFCLKYVANIVFVLIFRVDSFSWGVKECDMTFLFLSEIERISAFQMGLVERQRPTAECVCFPVLIHSAGSSDPLGGAPELVPR